jgi:hypothetical protein
MHHLFQVCRHETAGQFVAQHFTPFGSVVRSQQSARAQVLSKGIRRLSERAEKGFLYSSCIQKSPTASLPIQDQLPRVGDGEFHDLAPPGTQNPNRPLQGIATADIENLNAPMPARLKPSKSVFTPTLLTLSPIQYHLTYGVCSSGGLPNCPASSSTCIRTVKTEAANTAITQFFNFFIFISSLFKLRNEGSWID